MTSNSGAPAFSNVLTNAWSVTNGAAASVVPVVIQSSGAYSLNVGTAEAPAGLLESGLVVAGILDPLSTDRIFNPLAEGNAVNANDTATMWLPAFNTAGLFGGVSPATVNDQYWAPVFRDQSGATVDASNTQVGQVTLYLKPGASNVVEAASVMTFKVSPQAVVLMVPGVNTF